MHIVDRRLNPGGKSLANRQRFLRRAKALVQGAVTKASQDRDIKDVLEGGEVSIPLDGMHEPRFRTRRRHARHRAARQQEVHRRRHICRAPGGGGGSGSEAAATATARTISASCCRRDEFVDLFLDDLELPDLAKRKLAESREREACTAPAIPTSGSPANLSVSRTMRTRAVAPHRAASGRSRTRSTQLEAEIAALPTRTSAAPSSLRRARDS